MKEIYRKLRAGKGKKKKEKENKSMEKDLVGINMEVDRRGTKKEEVIADGAVYMDKFDKGKGNGLGKNKDDITINFILDKFVAEVFQL